MQCTATSKQTKQQCKRHAAPGRTVCNIHGGKTPQGVAAPSYTHGRYSKVIPARLAERYSDGLSDPQLLELREEIALLDARLGDVLGEIDGLGDPARWADAQRAWAAYTTAPNAALKAKAQTELDYVIDQGANQHAAWAALQQIIEQRRKLVESEHKRLVIAQQMITTEQAMALIGALIGIIRHHIHDRRILAAIQADAAQLLDRPGDPGADR
jgi:hypothetical protein